VQVAVATWYLPGEQPLIQTVIRLDTECLLEAATLDSTQVITLELVQKLSTTQAEATSLHEVPPQGEWMQFQPTALFSFGPTQAKLNLTEETQALEWLFKFNVTLTARNQRSSLAVIYRLQLGSLHCLILDEVLAREETSPQQTGS
jgi:hypothetical protein